MTEEIFLTLLNRSITAGWLVLAVLVLRLLLKKAPKALFTALWALVAIRLLCPVSLESRFSLIQNAEPVPQELFSSLPQNPGIPAGDVLGVKEPDVPDRVEEPQNPFSAADGDKAHPEHRKENKESTGEDSAAGQEKPGLSVLTAASFIWLAGMAGMLFYGVFSYWRILRKVRESVPLEGKVRICDRIDAPFILGVFRPRIYLPSAVNETDIVYILAHENAHLKRYDHIWKPLGFLLLSVYWFHPLLWLSYVLLCRDIELACDEKVIKKLGAESKKPYSAALINCSVPHRMIAACPLAFGEVSVKRRIKSVLNYKKPTFWIMLAAIAAFVGAGICFLTNPKKKELPVSLAKSGLELTPDTAAEGIFDDSREQIRLYCELENGEKAVYLNGKKQMTVPEEKKLLLYDMRSEDAFLELIVGEQVTVNEREFWHVTAYRVHQDGLKEISLFPSGEDNSFLIEDWDWLSFQGKFVQLDLTEPGKGGIYELTPEGQLVRYNEKQTAITVQGETLLLPEQNVVVYRETGFGIAFELLYSMASTSHYNIYRSEDGGKSWTLVAEDFMHEVAEIEQIYIQDRNTVFCCFGIGGGTAKKSCLMSKDGGVTWEYSALQFTYNEKADTDIIDWKDKLLEEAMRQATGITDRPITWGDVKDITELDLSNNAITDISALSGLTSLTTLNLSMNSGLDPGSLSGLTNLTILDLSYNELTDTGVLAGFVNLTELSLCGNGISDVSGLSELTNLIRLNLSENEVINANSLAGLKNLKELYLGRNKLSDAGWLSELENLTTLDLNTNALTDISSLSELKNLTTLLLSYNRLTDVSSLSGLTKLTWLALSGNKLTDVDGLSDLSSLVTLDLRYNRFTDIDSLPEFPNLTTLYVSGDEFVTEGGIQSGFSVTGFTPANVGGHVFFTGKTAASLSEAEVGDTVRFGSYEQDNNAGNGKEAIEWLVLDKQDGKLLLLSKYALDAEPYNEESEDVTWETCTLRKWLNGTFYYTAFNPAEQKYIALTKVKNRDNWETDDGNATKDYVFLLSVKEVTRYFDSDPAVGDPERCVKVTEYAKAQGGMAYNEADMGYFGGDTEYDGNGCWWLRSPGDFNYSAAYTGFPGVVYRGGYTVVNHFNVVRPAFWFTLEP